MDFTQGLKKGYPATFKRRPRLFSTSDAHTGMWAKPQRSSFHNCSYLTKRALLISEVSSETCTVLIWEVKGIQQQERLQFIGRDVIPLSIQWPLVPI